MTRMRAYLAARSVRSFRPRKPTLSTRLLLPVLTFAIPCAVYTATLAPTITWRNNGADGAELAVAAFTLGIAHPPGYPLYSLVGRLFALLPLGGIAYRLNLMSAVFGAGTCVWVYLVARNLFAPVSSRRKSPTWHLRAAAFAAAVLYGFSPALWGQAVIAEVYTLHAFLVGLLTWLGVRGLGQSNASAGGETPRRPWLLYGMAFLFGLGLGNHLMLLLLLPSAVLWIWAGIRPRAKETWIAGAFLAIGLLIYVYLPLRAAAYPALNWGDPQDWDGWSWLVSGQLYRPYLFALPSNLLPERAGAWMAMLVQQFTPLGFVLGALGLVGLFSRKREWTLPAFLYFCLVSLFAITYNTTDSYVYLIPAYFIFAVWLAGGLFWLLDLGAELSKPTFLRGRLDVVLIVLLGVILPTTALASRWTAQDLHADQSAYHYAQEVLSSVDQEAMVIAGTDEHLFSLWYLQFVENQRPDVSIVAAPLIDYPWYRRNLRRLYPGLVLRDTQDNTPRLWTLVQDNLSARAIYLTDPNPIVEAAFFPSPSGKVIRVLPLQ